MGGGLAAFEPLSAKRIKLQAEGLRLLDAELVTLVEIKNENHIRAIANHHSMEEVKFNYSLVEQIHVCGSTNHGSMHISIIYKEGIALSNSELME